MDFPSALSMILHPGGWRRSGRVAAVLGGEDQRGDSDAHPNIVDSIPHT